MTKAYLQLLSKNYALFGERIEIDTECLPRIGEIIDAHEFIDLEPSQVGDFMVYSVIYKLTSKGFVPYITARQWHKGFRHEVLQERGWLPPENYEMLTYDEDDPARREDA